MVDTERRSINKRLQALIPLPLVSLIVLLVLLGYVVFAVGENVVRPLARITRECEAVASGLFQRITPYGKEGNEIHATVWTINRMMDELEKRHEQLIQSRKIASDLLPGNWTRRNESLAGRLRGGSGRCGGADSARSRSSAC